MRKKNPGFIDAAALLLPSAVIVVALWMPFGFSMTGLIEEWDLLGLFALFGPFGFVSPDGPLAMHGLRPLMPLSFAVAHLLDRDSFVGWHLLMMLSLVVKGGAMTYLVRHATDSRSWGVIAGALFLVYPADTMQLSFRSIHINTAIALSLVACAMLVRSFGAKRPVCAVATSVAAALLFLVGVSIYEVALTLVALPFAVHFVRRGRDRGSKSRALQFVIAGPWLAVGCVYLGYAAWLARRISSYQGQVTGDSQGLFAMASTALPHLFSIGAARLLIGGWLDAARMVATEFASFIYLGCAAAMIALAILLTLQFDRRDGALPKTRTGGCWGMPARLMLAGFLLMLMGYAPFLTSAAHLAISQRTFLWATPGAAMACTGALIMLWRLARAPAAAAMLALLVFGLGAQLFQFHHYANLSERQRSALRALVEGFDPTAPATTVLVLDDSNQLGHTWMFPTDTLLLALTYLYGHRIAPLEICRTSEMEWQRVDGLKRQGRCVEDEAGWTLTPAPPVSGPDVPPAAPGSPRRLPREQVSVVRIGVDGESVVSSASQARRHRLQSGTSTIDRRYRAILEGRPLGLVGPMFRDEVALDHYRWEFGDWWSLELPPRGAGWREADWFGDGLAHRSGAWKTAPTADLNFDLAPAPGRYVARGRFDQFAGDGIRNSMRVRINGQSVLLQWTSPSDFTAEVPAGVLKQGANRLEFESGLNDQFYGLSAWLNWVELEPVRGAGP